MTDELFKTEILSRDYRLMLWAKKRRDLLFRLTQMTILFDVPVKSLTDNPLELIQLIIAEVKRGATQSHSERLAKMQAKKKLRHTLSRSLASQIARWCVRCPRTRYLSEFFPGNYPVRIFPCFLTR